MPRKRAAQPITHALVIETILEEQFDDANQASGKVFKYSATAWCRAQGVALDDAAEKTLGDSFESCMQRYQTMLERSAPNNNRTGKNVRTAARKMNAAYLALLASQDLPADFNAAFKSAMDAKGFAPKHLIQMLKARYFADKPNWQAPNVYLFYNGTAGPGRSWHGDSRQLLTYCEEILGLSSGTLVSRAYPVVKPILVAPPKVIRYRQSRSEMHFERYSLKQLPARILKIFNDYVEWRHQKVVLVDGKTIGVDPRSIWTSPSTVSMHRTALLRYLGWLTMPAADRPLSELTPQERWRTGEGLHPDELTMAHVMDLRLIWKFIEYLRFRQHNQALSRSHSNFLMGVNAFYSMPYSYLAAHQELASEFGFEPPSSAEQWKVTLEARHQLTIQMIRTIERSIGHTKQRSPDEPLRHLMEDEAPYALVLRMIDRMEQNPPLKANVQTWSVWARDVALFRMESEVPLRAKNVIELTIGRHLTRDERSGLWHVLIKKEEMKNLASKHAHNISRTYSPTASIAIDRYINEARPNFVGHGISDYFFLGPAAGKRANPEFMAKKNYRISKDAIASAIERYLRRYFGESQGVNFFRHVIATSILKDDPTQVEMASAVLNNSPDAIKQNYRHLTQSDGLRNAQGWIEKQIRRRRRGEGSDGADSN
ncbi:hypothetical protein DBR42_10875 [Pelomonas sp. HMWF004]|nr:hypothetical protein DBR42_10875 [Pelomonas sp. HMWF004]